MLAAVAVIRRARVGPLATFARAVPKLGRAAAKMVGRTSAAARQRYLCMLSLPCSVQSNPDGILHWRRRKPVKNL